MQYAQPGMPMQQQYMQQPGQVLVEQPQMYVQEQVVMQEVVPEAAPQPPAMDANRYLQLKQKFAERDMDQTNCLDANELAQVMADCGMEASAEALGQFFQNL